MSARTLDLTLLEPLEAILQEQSVTGAARRMGVSQPALSATLGKLRRHYGDQILARSGNRYQLTPFAEMLRPQVERALAHARSTLQPRAEAFDPREIDREFVIHASDYAIAMLGGRIAMDVSHVAPRARVAMLHFDAPALIANPKVIAGLDGILLPHGFITDLPHMDVFHDEWVCLVSSANTRVADRLTVQDLRNLPWITIYRDSWLATAAERQLRMHGVELRSAMVTDSFLSLPFLVADSDRLALVPRMLAERAALRQQLRVLDCPIPLTPLAEAMWWHPTGTDDPALAWLRGVISAVGRELGKPGERRPQPGATAARRSSR